MKPPKINWRMVCAVVAIGLAGMFLVTFSHAATPTAAIEPEAGQSASNAQELTDSSASGGQVVKFGSQPGLLSSKSPEGNPRYAYRMFGGNDDPSRIPATIRSKYAVYLLSPYMTTVAQTIRTSNPSALIYMYKDSSSARRNLADPASTWCNADGGTVGHDWGIDYCDANANHTNWFMTMSGSRFEYSGYAYHWHMNVGASGYKERWASNALQDLRANSAWTGVFIDNQLTDIRSYTPSSGYPDQYSSVVAGQSAYTTFADYVGTTIRSAGYGVISNTTNGRLYPGIWNAYTANQSGGYDEFWESFGQSGATINNLPAYGGVGWEAQVAEADTITQGHKLGIFTAQASGGTCAECKRYGLATYLLINDGFQTFQEGNVDALPGDYVSSDPMYGWQLGSATGSRAEIQGTGSNLFERTFANGLVIVNADNTSSRVVSLGGTYKDETGVLVTQVTIGPTRGRILRQ